MSEIPHPERRPTEALRPVEEIVISREKLRRSAIVFSSEWNTDQVSQNLNNIVESLSMNESQKTRVSALIPIELKKDKAFGWRDGLQYVLKKESPTSFFNTISQMWKDTSSVDDAHGATKSFEDVINANREVSFQQELLEREKSQTMLNLTADEYKKKKELERIVLQSGKIKDLIDYQLEMGETGPKIESLEDFFMPDLLTPENSSFLGSVQMVRTYEGVKARIEALDWVLGEEDGNNGLARMLAEQRENPLRL